MKLNQAIAKVLQETTEKQVSPRWIATQINEQKLLSDTAPDSTVSSQDVITTAGKFPVWFGVHKLNNVVKISLKKTAANTYSPGNK